MNSTISSSNLQKAINSALDMSTNLNETLSCGDLVQKKKIQNLVVPSGFDCDKSNGNFEPKAKTLYSPVSHIYQGN